MRQIAVEASFWTTLTHLSVWLSILVYFAVVIIYSLFQISSAMRMYNIGIEMYSSAICWLVLLISSTAAIIPDVIIK
jgi:hypothetical protein